MSKRDNYTYTVTFINTNDRVVFTFYSKFKFGILNLNKASRYFREIEESTLEIDYPFEK